jgi:hypothetical protein
LKTQWTEAYNYYDSEESYDDSGRDATTGY